MEEELRNQRAMVALLRLELVDLVAGAKPTLVVQLADNALLDDPAIPAAAGSLLQNGASQWRSSSASSAPPTLRTRT